MYNSAAGTTGSIKMSNVPPQTNPESYLGSLFRLKVSVRGFSCSMTSRAACQTSASTQPPPMVPTIEPSSRTSIFAVSNEGIEPAHVHDGRERTLAALLPQLHRGFVDIGHVPKFYFFSMTRAHSTTPLALSWSLRGKTSTFQTQRAFL